MLMRRYEMPWRRAYEVYAAAVWASALLFFAVTGGLGLLPRQLALPLAAFCLAMGVLRLAQGVQRTEGFCALAGALNQRHQLLERGAAIHRHLAPEQI